jgi:raffinose/stachyose/melibiose transport system substrate-binding protein
MMRRSSVAQVLALGAALAVLAGCGTGSDTGSSTKGSSASGGAATTITWWHNSNTDPGKSYYEQVARTYEAAHPGVTIQISAMQHEDMLTKLDAAFQGGDAPDIYMERGGGELAAHVQAGLVKDISAPAADVIAKLGGSVAGWQADGKTYALPFSVGVVGFWYNKSLFARAGITAPPASLDELLADTKTLRAAGIEPISVGAGDKWPAAHYWYYLSLRECPQQVLQDAVKSLDFSNACFVTAGQELEKIIKDQPFNKGFLSTPAQSGPTSASGLLATG